MHQFLVQQTDAAIHRHADQTDDDDADENDVEHEQLSRPDHQVADAFTGSQQFDGQQRRPAGGQRQAHASHERGEGGGQYQAPNQQAWWQAQNSGGFTQFRLGISYADQCVQGHRHHDRFDQHHQFQHFADAEKHHEQWNPRQRRYLRQAGEGREDQTFKTLTEAQCCAEQCTGRNPGKQAPEQTLQADPQMAP
ncbi:hypothetical protein D3C81_1511980 [compost metagenome]